MIIQRLDIALFNGRKLDIYDGPKLKVLKDASTYAGRKIIYYLYSVFFEK